MLSTSHFTAPGRDQSPFSALRDMYRRYMTNPAVSRWLLDRQPGKDFLTASALNSLLVSIQPAQASHELPNHIARPTNFIPSSDLIFMDHCEAGYALGHIWGSDASADTHPLAQLTTGVSMAGWTSVRCRRFASALISPDVWERVEFVWFHDHRAIIILTSSPLSAGAQFLSTCEVLFHGPVHHQGIPQSADLILHIRDLPLCVRCRAGEAGKCRCSPQAHSVSHTEAARRESNTTSAPSGFQDLVSPPTWESQMKRISAANSRGLLNIQYFVSNAGKHEQRRSVRYAYALAFGSQSDVNERIHSHLRRLIMSRPPTASGLVPVAGNANHLAKDGERPTLEPCIVPTVPPTDVPRSGALDAPVTSTGIEAWLETVQPAKQAVASVEQGRGGCCVGAASEDCVVSEQLCGDAKGSCGLPSSCSRDPPTTGRIASSAPIVSANHPRVQQFAKQDNLLCGPEKAGIPCDCSAETTPDPYLAAILMSRKDVVAASLVDMADVNSYLTPLPVTPKTAANLLQSFQPGSSDSQATSQKLDFRPEDTNGDQQRSATTFGGTCSPESTKCLPGSLLPSPQQACIPESGVRGPPCKRRRSDAEGGNEMFNFSLESSWIAGCLDDSGKSGQLRELPAVPIPMGVERPTSAIARGLGLHRTPSPFAYIGSLQTHGSPSRRNDARGSSAATGGMVQFAGGAEEHRNGYAQADGMAKLGGGCGKTNSYPVADERRSRSEIGVGNRAGLGKKDFGGSEDGVRCDLCGITLSKQSNLLRHMNTVHNSVKQFECERPMCGSKFGLKADLRRHMVRIHESRAFCCDKCGRSFAEQQRLDEHVRSTHEEDTSPWECKTCGMRFGRKSSLRRHEKTVHGESRFQCSICTKSYSQRFDAVKHCRATHPNCDNCKVIENRVEESGNCL